MKQLIQSLIICILIFSCKPTFNKIDETKTIKDFLNGNIDIENQLSLFPNSYLNTLTQQDIDTLNDSINTLFENSFFKYEQIIIHKFKINKISSTKKIGNYFFKIINFDELLKIKKERENIYLYDFKALLDENLIEYVDNESNILSPLTVTLNNNMLSFWDSNSKQWNYILYNDEFNLKFFGVKTTKELINLYFEEIFITARNSWDKESLKIFYDVYEEVRNDDIYKELNFDEFCKCKIKHYEKIEEEYKDIPDEYYNSLSYLEIIYRCQIFAMKI